MAAANSETTNTELGVKMDHMHNDLKEIKVDVKAINGRLRCVEQEQAALKVKAGVWGGIAGAVTVALGILISLVGRLF